MSATWLSREAGDTPDLIGGRGTDVAQIAYSLRARIRDAFPINGVPVGVVAALDECEVVCQIEEVIRRVDLCLPEPLRVFP